MSNPDWSPFVLVCDPGVGQQITTLHPAFAVTFYIHRPDYAAVAQLFDAAMDLVKPQLTHYQAESMKRPEPLTAKAYTMVPAWMRKPRVMHAYWWTAYGGKDFGVAPPGFELSVMGMPKLGDVEHKRALENAIVTQGVGEQRGAPTSAVQLLLPVDHQLANAGRLLEWLAGLDLIKRGGIISAEAGYLLSSMASAFGGESESRERALCSRYPGLDCFRLSHITHMLRADPAYPDFVPLVRRAAWTLVLHPLTVAFLGGEDAIRAQLADEPDFRVSALPHGLALQAGERPQLGDLTTGDDLPLLRRMAKVVRPARMERPAEESDFWEHFFNIFDKKYS